MARIIRSAVVALLATAVLVAAPDALAKKRKDHEPDPTLAPAPPPPPPPVVANGAIFQAAAGYAPLTSGNRAARVGDIITIQLVERTAATKSARTETAKDGGLGITPPTTGPLALFSESDVKIGSNSSFSGSGTTAQTNQLSGEITVTVAAVHPNGVMEVRGEKRVTINRGDEYIRVTGLIRPADVSADNRILSSRVADARITYAGNGDIARASRQGWLSRFFQSVSPF